jgi:hypothetical protein
MEAVLEASNAKIVKRIPQLEGRGSGPYRPHAINIFFVLRGMA